MSAYLCSNKHLNALLSFAYAKRMLDSDFAPRHPSNESMTLTDIGRLLQAENLRSLRSRYGEKEDWNAEPFEARPGMPMSAVAIIKLCDCYDYQACESGDYAETKAAKVIRAIRSEAIHSLPGYDAAPWGL